MAVGDTVLITAGTFKGETATVMLIGFEYVYFEGTSKKGHKFSGRINARFLKPA